MFSSPLIIPLVAALLSRTTVSAAKVGYFDSEKCVDPSGLEKCYANAESAWSNCANVTCAGQNKDCVKACSCVRTQSQISCAGQHCWNQVYSCEYQQTAGDIASNCENPQLDQIPFFPAPDNAPGSCSCNIGKLLTSVYQTGNESQTCGANGVEVASDLTSDEEMESFARACTCCAESGALSAFWAICPNTDPSLIGIGEVYDSLIANDENWDDCGADMDVFPCDSELGYTPPGGKSGTFYKPGDFPPNGTATTVNIAGTITSPVSGATYTWTYNGVEHPVTIASVDAKPTSTAATNSTGSDVKKSLASSTAPGLLPISCGLFILVNLII